MELKVNKICFIICSNDLDKVEEAEFFIRKQYLPLNMDVKCSVIVDAASLAQGYNKAMAESDAKYKVYLHQDALLVYEKAIDTCLRIFYGHPEIGMLGLIGCKDFTANGCWWDGTERYGRVIDNHTGKMLAGVKFKNTKDFTYVKMLDGFFMMTQYDVQWREEIFDGWHFYDASQCREFDRYGYKIAVPYQERPWCVHSCGVSYGYKKEYEKYRMRYLREYSSK